MSNRDEGFMPGAIEILRAVSSNARDISLEQRSARAFLARYDYAMAEDEAWLEHRQRLVAGWKKCCRCFPNLVLDSGFCRCCGFDHKTGIRTRDEDPT